MMPLPVLLPRSQVVAWLACAALLASAVSGAGGAWLGYRHASAQGSAALARLQADHARQQAANTQKAADRYRTEVERGHALAQDLAARQDQIAALREQLKRRIPHVTTAYQTAAHQPPIPLPRCVFVAGWVWDYNAAFGLVLPGDLAAASAGGTEPRPETASPAGAELLGGGEFLDSGISQADLLAHAEDLAAYLAAVEAQRDALKTYCSPTHQGSPNP